ncbi:hypothetical protein WJ970_31190 [Achromobacter xylosoxidans]
MDGVKRMPSEPTVVGRPEMPLLDVSSTWILPPPQGFDTVWLAVLPPLLYSVLDRRTVQLEGARGRVQEIGGTPEDLDRAEHRVAGHRDGRAAQAGRGRPRAPVAGRDVAAPLARQAGDAAAGIEALLRGQVELAGVVLVDGFLEPVHRAALVAHAGQRIAFVEDGGGRGLARGARGLEVAQRLAGLAHALVQIAALHQQRRIVGLGRQGLAHALVGLGHLRRVAGGQRGGQQPLQVLAVRILLRGLAGLRDGFLVVLARIGGIGQRGRPAAARRVRGQQLAGRAVGRVAAVLDRRGIVGQRQRGGHGGAGAGALDTIGAGLVLGAQRFHQGQRAGALAPGQRGICGDQAHIAPLAVVQPFLLERGVEVGVGFLGLALALAQIAAHDQGHGVFVVLPERVGGRVLGGRELAVQHQRGHQQQAVAGGVGRQRHGLPRQRTASPGRLAISA